MDRNELIRINDLVENPTPRVPVCLCLDVSDSMNAVEGGDYVDTGRVEYSDGKEWHIVEGGTTRLSELKSGINAFYDGVGEDEIAVYSAEISIVTFGDTAQCVMDFANIERQKEIPDFQAAGNTAMGEGVNLALDLLEKRKSEYADKGVDYYQPWLVIMTDGEPNGNEAEFARAKARIADLVSKRKLTVFPVGIGAEANLNILKELSPKRVPLKLKGLKFREFFQWLSQSVSTISQSMPGETIKWDLDGIKSWGEL